MTKLADRPEDCGCEGCWDARPVPGLERDFYLCDYHDSEDYGHLVHYRHCCQCFSIGDRGEKLFLKPAVARVELGVTPEIGRGNQPDPGRASEIDSRGWWAWFWGVISQFWR